MVKYTCDNCKKKDIEKEEIIQLENIDLCEECVAKIKSPAVQGETLTSLEVKKDIFEEVKSKMSDEDLEIINSNSIREKENNYKEEKN